MPLDIAKANSKTAALNEAFAEIGIAGGTKMPPSKLNTEPVAWEYFVASLLARFADARKTAATKAAIKAGLMFDHAKEPRPTGTNALIYAGDVVEITVAVTTATSRLDADGFFDAVEKAGVKRSVLDRLVAAHTTENRPPHKFTAVMATT
jgi:hypothetical protein